MSTLFLKHPIILNLNVINSFVPNVRLKANKKQTVVVEIYEFRHKFYEFMVLIKHKKLIINKLIF